MPRSKPRPPTAEERKAIEAWKEIHVDRLREKSDPELHGILWAMSYEIARRDGLQNAAIAFEQYAMKLLETHLADQNRRRGPETSS